MEVTPKTIRRAQARLLAQAEVEAGRRDISTVDALLNILETEGNSDLIVKAFSQSVASAPGSEIPDY